MSKDNKIKINPDILKWALNNLNYSISHFAKKINVKEDIVQKWLNGEDYPTYKQLEKISYKALKISTTMFFFDEVPKENLKAYFRTTSNHTLENLDPNIMIFIKKIKYLQNDLLELFNNKNPSDNFILDKIKEIDNNNISYITLKLRDILNIDIDTQKNFKKPEIALKKWRDAIEKNGILVRKNALKNNDISGFCLYDQVFPIIVINNSLPFNRQIFTIFHEIAHLIFKVSGIDEIDENFSDLANNSKNIEILCNNFASEFLLPKNEILKFSNYNIDDDIILNISKDFSVSREVVVKRCLDINLIGQKQYNEYIKKYTKEYFNYKRKKNTKGGGSFYNTHFSYLGENYIKLIFNEYYENKINRDELLNFLDLNKDEHADKIESLLYNREEKE